MRLVDFGARGYLHDHSGCPGTRQSPSFLHPARAMSGATAKGHGVSGFDVQRCAAATARYLRVSFLYTGLAERQREGPQEPEESWTAPTQVFYLELRR